MTIGALIERLEETARDKGYQASVSIQPSPVTKGKWAVYVGSEYIAEL